MTLPGRKSRGITVDGVAFRWAVSPDSGYMWLVVEHASGSGQRVEAVFDYGVPLTPAVARRVIERALATGWRPLEGGLKPLRLDGGDRGRRVAAGDRGGGTREGIGMLFRNVVDEWRCAGRFFGKNLHGRICFEGLSERRPADGTPADGGARVRSV